MLQINVSTVSDGSMKSLDGSYTSVLPNRTIFLKSHNIQPEDTTLVHLVYEGDDYNRFHVISDLDKGDGIIRPPSYVADGMVVTNPGHALLLPLADCVGAVIHDPTRNILMLTHLGRHNLEQAGATKSVEYLVSSLDVVSINLTVWLSPAAGEGNYPLFAFDNRSLHNVAREQFMAAGVSKTNITISPIDVTKDKNYFSHSEFLKGNRPSDGRFALVAVLR